MSLFFETILIKDKKINNLNYHNARLNKTIESNFGIKSSINLEDFISLKGKKTQRCKVIYDKNIQDIQFFEIIKRDFNSFKLIESDIEYDYKYLDRSSIDRLYKQKGSCDDILIIKDGLITDTSIANIAYFDDNVWITPKKPLFRGTMREYLLDHKLLLEKDVKIKHIKDAKRVALMNAILGFFEITNPKFI